MDLFNKNCKNLLAYLRIEGHIDGIIRENTGEAHSGKWRGLWAKTMSVGNSAVFIRGINSF